MYFIHFARRNLLTPIHKMTFNVALAELAGVTKNVSRISL